MDQTLLGQYASLEVQVKEIEARKAELRARILEELKKNNLKNFNSEVFGSFTVVKKPIWQYSEAIDKIKERLALAKIREQDKGIAKAIDGEHLHYTPIS